MKVMKLEPNIYTSPGNDHKPIVMLSWASGQKCKHGCEEVERAVGHFSLTLLSAYSELSTLIDWLW